VPFFKAARESLSSMLGEKAKDLPSCSGNFYADAADCGVGWHGDSQRSKVIGLRLGASINVCFMWFQGGQPISARSEVILEHGDFYVMSEKAVGWDWKGTKQMTVRHAVGGDKFTGISANNYILTKRDGHLNKK
jgi:hypothetical protein